MVFPQLLDEHCADAGAVPVADGAVCGGRGGVGEMARGWRGASSRSGDICVLLLSRRRWAVPHRVAPHSPVSVLLVWTSPTAARSVVAGPGAAVAHRCSLWRWSSMARSPSHR